MSPMTNKRRKDERNNEEKDANELTIGNISSYYNNAYFNFFFCYFIS